MIDFVLNHFDELATLPGAVPKLRSFILDQAVRGNLTADWRKEHPDTEPASVLLQRIKEEKKELEKAGKIRKQKDLPPVDPDEVPFVVPESWEWVRLRELAEVHGGGTPSKSKPEYWGDDYLWITPKDMKTNELSDTELKITEKGIRNSSATLIQGPAIIVVGRSGILRRRIPIARCDREFTVNQDMKVFRPFLTDMVAPMMCLLRGLEPIGLAHLIKYGMTVHSLRYDEYAAQPFPLASLQEQREIVRRVDDLRALVERLRQTAEHRSKQAGSLLSSLENK